MLKKRFSHVQIIAIGFAAMIAVGTLLLMLPFSSAARNTTPFLTAFFTAVSSSCVTGLITVDTGTYWSLFGQIVIIILIQIGGLGFMTIATLFMSFAKRGIDIRKRAIMAESINSSRIFDLKGLSRKIIKGTLIFEGTGAALLSIRFCRDFGLARGIYYGIFHSVSAFCNAGFDLMGVNEPYSSFVSYGDDILVNVVIMILITVGGIGFLVWDEVTEKRFHLKRYSLHAKITLVTSLILSVGGAVLFFAFEKNGAFSELSAPRAALRSLFASVSCRTAGMNTFDLTKMGNASMILSDILMFIGGSSGSTAGGIKTTTVAVLLIDCITELRGKKRSMIFGRTIDNTNIKRASVVARINLLLMLAATVIISAEQNCGLRDILFETSSAIGTVGLSTGLTRELTPISLVTLCVLMFCGRVGSVSFAAALFEKKADPRVTYPTEQINVG